MKTMFYINIGEYWIWVFKINNRVNGCLGVYHFNVKSHGVALRSDCLYNCCTKAKDTMRLKNFFLWVFRVGVRVTLIHHHSGVSWLFVYFHTKCIICDWCLLNEGAQCSSTPAPLHPLSAPTRVVISRGYTARGRQNVGLWSRALLHIWLLERSRQVASGISSVLSAHPPTEWQLYWVEGFIFDCVCFYLI